MVYSLTYRRPAYRPNTGRSSVIPSEDYENSRDSVKSGHSGGLSAGIPDALSFDKIVNGGTCPVSLPSISFLSESCPYATSIRGAELMKVSTSVEPKMNYCLPVSLDMKS
jgi:hypothetical protein